MLVFLSLATRRVELVACTANPDTAWMTQQARNVLMELGERERRMRFLIHDREVSPRLRRDLRQRRDQR